MNEADLVRRCRESPETFSEIYERWFEPILSYSMIRTGNISDAEDVTSRTFIKASHKIADFNYKGVKISTWIYRIATNEINSFFRRQKIKNLTGFSLTGSPLSPSQELKKAENEISRNQAFQRVNLALKKMKTIDQSLIALRYFKNMTYGDIAEILQKREGSLRMRCNRALKKLKEELMKEGCHYGSIRETFEGNENTGSQCSGI